MKKNALIAEFIGTFALIFVGVGAIASDSLPGVSSGLVGIAFAHGLTIAVMVAATAAISGGHLNPAVTIGLLSVKKIDQKTAFNYIIVQCLGAIVAAALLKLCIPSGALSIAKMGTPALRESVTPLMGLLLESILTFFLMFVIYGTAVDKKGPNQMAGLFIGLTVGLDVLVGGPLTGAAMNPARHLGPALLGGGLKDIWLYWLGPVIGAVAASQVYSRFVEK